MKSKIHPIFYPDAKVSCACGHTFTTGSTQKELKVEICSKCHPFYTGKSKLVDTAGVVDRFKAKLVKAEAKKTAHKKKVAKPAKKTGKK